MTLRRARVVAMLIASIVLAAGSGCARRSGLMDARRDGGPLPAPPSDKAVVVFLRPAYTGYAISAAVYEDETFLGIVMRHARLPSSPLPTDATPPDGRCLPTPR